MKYIESEELRDWVKDNLRKTIFQKAHALAVQTGCEVLVKLQDTRDITGRQYYATHNLQRAYMNNALRKHPAEMFVSGETGLPLVNQATQIGESADNVEPNGVLSNEASTVSTAGNQTDGDDVPGDIQIKMEAMSGDEDSSDIPHDNITDEEPGMDVDMYTNINPSPRNHGTSSQRYTSSQSPQHLYQCAICQKTFRTINILQMHTQTFHLRSVTMMSPTRMLNIRGKARSGRKSYAKQEQEQRRYPCSMCERTFHHPDLLKDHVSRSHMGQSILASSLKGIQATSSAVTTDTSSPSSSMSQSQIQVSSGSSSQGFQDNPGTSDVTRLEEDVSDQHIQMSPLKQLIPTEAFLGNLGNHPSSIFCQSSPTPSFKHPSGGPSSRNNTPASNQGEAKGPMPIIKIMKAILAIGGPVATANTVKDNLRNRNYDRVTNDLFVDAANQLKDMGLGYLVACKNGSGRLVDVFIKKPPEEVVDILEANSGLCDPSVYATTFASQTPVRLMRSSQLMDNLIASGLVSEEHLKPHQMKSLEANEQSYSSMNMFDGNSMGVAPLEVNDGGFSTTCINVFDGNEGGMPNPDEQLGNDEGVPNPDVQLGNSSDSFTETFVVE
ncbi:uncharacterized protein [Amphiura filiformis]|uniref:uncharacterized protein isoform X1 n=1 Tax=Amphiura filiformis TaxID=82378 RepID=UPI003B227F87